MSCSVFRQVLVLIVLCSVSTANAKDLVTDKLSEKTLLTPYAEYSISTSDTSLDAVVTENDWRSELPQRVSSSTVIWMRVRLQALSKTPQLLTCMVAKDVETELYVDQQRISELRYFVKSIWLRYGITYFYCVEIDKGFTYLYLKILPKKTPEFGLLKRDFAEISNGFYLIKTDEFSAQFKSQNKENEAARRITFLIIGGLGVIALISLLITSFWRRRLFIYYFIYGFSPFLLLVIKEVCFSFLVHSTTFQPYINTFSRASEVLQLVSLSAYVMFVAELLDFQSNHLRFYKVFVILAILMLFQGIIEVGWLFLTLNIEGYENLVAWSSSLLFPIFIGVIVWMSILIRHHLIKYVIVSNAIFVGMLFLGFLRFSVFDNAGIPVYFDSFFKLPFATLIEMVVFSFAIAAKISYDNQLRLESEKRLRESEMMALRSQMNPHFIFNSLNTVRNFILQNDTLNANKYLSKFSRLLRQILNFSRSNVISLGEELETVRLYLELESARFESGFRYEINVPADLETDAIRIPSLLLQPYVENAIWHGLRHSQNAAKILTINLSEQIGVLIISILDNGVGREEAAKLKSETKDSLGTKITQERIALFNINENSALRVETKDVVSGGTEVVLTYQLY